MTAVAGLLGLVLLSVLACGSAPRRASHFVARGDGPLKTTTSSVAMVCVANLTTASGRAPEAADEPAVPCSASSNPWGCDAGTLCQTLESQKVPTLASKRAALSASEVEEALAPLAAARYRIAFYSGHGEATPEVPGGATFITRRTDEPHDVAPGAESPMTGLTAARLLQKLDRGARGSVLLANTCDSAYVDLRVVAQPTAVIASGYGEIDGARRTGPNSLFGSLLVRALAGEADRLPRGNCDGIVSDQEAHEFLNDELFRAASANEKEWQKKPLAVLKRNVEWQLPVAWPGPDPACARFYQPALASFYRSLESAKGPSALPGSALTQLKQAAAEYLEPLVAPGIAERDPDPAIPRQFLLVAAHGTPAKDLTPLLSGLEKLRQQGAAWPMLWASPGAELTLAAGARALSYLDILLLRVRITESSELFLELLRLRDGLITWAGTASLPLEGEAGQAAAIEVARRLPRAVSLVRVSNNLGLISTVLRSLGPIPPKPVLTRWRDLFAPSPGGVPIDLPASGPCPGGIGQCFFVPSLPEELETWLVRR